MGTFRKTEVHLISAPWQQPIHPSIQIGALQAYIDSRKYSDIHCKSYSAFLEIPYRLLEERVFEDWHRFEKYEEYGYSLCYLERFEKKLLKASKTNLEKLLKQVNVVQRHNSHPLTISSTKKMIKATQAYLKDKGLLDLDSKNFHVVCFTLNYHQVMSSLYLAREIHESCKNVVFVFGGMSASIPQVVEVLNEARIPAFCVLGEGEKKLAQIVETVQEKASLTDSKMIQAVLQEKLPKIPGIFSVGCPPTLYIKDKKMYEGQISKLEELPIPDYDEYFNVIREMCDDEETYPHLLERLVVLGEGSRGCFAKCAFCGLNYLWQGFRKSDSDFVFRRTTEILKKYPVTEIKFVDNVCDTWAEGYADLLISNRTSIPAFMELRAHHPQHYWTKLALAGVNDVQIGIEALSKQVLALIGKGTTIAQNVLAGKYLTELKIQSISNLITYYPGSSAADVEETKSLLMKLDHFPRYDLAKFMMVQGSPLFEKLSLEQRKALKNTVSIRFPEVLSKYQIEFGHDLPESMLSKKSRQAWDQFHSWYPSHLEKLRNQPSRRHCKTLVGGRIKVEVEAQGKSSVEILEGREAAVFSYLHRGASRKLVEEKLGVSSSELEPILKKFVHFGWVLDLDGTWVNVCLRPKEELVLEYLCQTMEIGSNFKSHGDVQSSTLKLA